MQHLSDYTQSFFVYSSDLSELGKDLLSFSSFLLVLEFVFVEMNKKFKNLLYIFCSG